MREGYAVQVLKWGEPILTIEHECLSGKELDDDEEQAVRDCAAHLHSFVGDGKPQPCWMCGGVAQCVSGCELANPTLETEEPRSSDG